MSPRRGVGSVRIGGQEVGIGATVIERVVQEERAAYLVRRAELAPLPPVAERGKMLEREWQKQIVAVATRIGWYSYHPHLSKWSARGWPDLSLLHGQRHRALWIEVKDDDGNLSTEQVKVIDLMLASGLEVHVCRPHHGLDHVAQLLSA